MSQDGYSGDSEGNEKSSEWIDIKEAEKSFFSFLLFAHFEIDLHDVFSSHFSLIGSGSGFKVGIGLHSGGWNRVCESSTGSRTWGNTARIRRCLPLFLPLFLYFYVYWSCLFFLYCPVVHLAFNLSYLHYLPRIIRGISILPVLFNIFFSYFLYYLSSSHSFFSSPFLTFLSLSYCAILFFCSFFPHFHLFISSLLCFLPSLCLNPIGR